MNILVNKTKEVRAKLILDFVNGKVVPKNADEQDKRDKFTAFLADAKVDAKTPAAVEFVYRKLGGLVRTEAEQAQAEAKKKEMQAKGRKKMVE